MFLVLIHTKELSRGYDKIVIIRRCFKTGQISHQFGSRLVLEIEDSFIVNNDQLLE